MFLKKDQVYGSAAAYGIDVSGLSWPQATGKVTKYLAKHGLEPVTVVERPENPDTAEMSADPTPVQGQHVAQVPVLVKGHTNRIQLGARKPELSIEDLGLSGKRIVFSPEIAPTRYQVFGYEEDLGEDMEVEELTYDGRTLDARGTSKASGTYKVRPIKGSRVIAKSGLPKENVGIYWDIDRDPYPIATFGGRRGYLWTHPTIPCMKPEIVRSKHYQEYKELLQDEQNCFYLGGKTLAVDINFAHWMMRDIEEKEAAKHARH